MVWIFPNFDLGYPVGKNFDWYRFVNASPIMIVATLLLTVFTTLVRPILETIFVPINFLTFGLASLIINIIILWLVTFLIPGFTIQSLTIGGINLGEIGSIALMSIVFSLLQSGLTLLF